jgi:hypothetical protein
MKIVKLSTELLEPAVDAVALKRNDERLKRLDPVVIFSSGIIPGNPKYLLLRGADSCALAHNIILSKDQVINLRNTLSKYLYEWDKS